MNKRLGMDRLRDYQRYLNNFTSNYEENDKLYELYRTSSTEEEKIIYRNKIVEANLPLIATIIACHYNYNYDMNPVYDMDDIIQEANLILIKSIDGFDFTKGKFSTYISMRVIPNIYYLNGIPNSPFYFRRGLASIYKKIKKLIDLEYDDNFISEHCNLDMNKIKKLRNSLRDSLSYDELLSKGFIDDVIEKQDSSFGNYLIEKIDKMSNVEKRDNYLYKLIEKLTDKEKELIIACYGLDNQEPIGLHEYSKKTGIPSGTVYQRHYSILKKLKNYKLYCLFLSVDRIITVY